MPKKKILILGGTAFVGRQLVEDLSKEETNHIYLFNRGKTNPELFQNTTRIIGDRETDDIKKIGGHHWDYVVDFSSYFPHSLQKTLDQINKDVKNYIYISTISVYPIPTQDPATVVAEDFPRVPFQEEQLTEPTLKYYGEKKSACEEVLNTATWLKTTILRPSLIYGKYDPTDRFYYWVKKIQEQALVLLPYDGSHLFTMTFADDFVKVILAGLNESLPSGVYNCNTHPPMSILSLMNLMKKTMGRECEFIFADRHALSAAKIRTPIHFGGHVNIDNSKLKDAVEFEFKSFEDTIKIITGRYEEENWPACSIETNLGAEQKFIAQNHD